MVLAEIRSHPQQLSSGTYGANAKGFAREGVCGHAKGDTRA